MIDSALKRKMQICHGKVQYALLKGTLLYRGCEKCGTDLEIVAHHDDYDKPLYVRFLCVQHHVELHRSPETFGGPYDVKPECQRRTIGKDIYGGLSYRLFCEKEDLKKMSRTAESVRYECGEAAGVPGEVKG